MPQTGSGLPHRIPDGRYQFNPTTSHWQYLKHFGIKAQNLQSVSDGSAERRLSADMLMPIGYQIQKTGNQLVVIFSRYLTILCHGQVRNQRLFRSLSGYQE